MRIVIALFLVLMFTPLATGQQEPEKADIDAILENAPLDLIEFPIKGFAADVFFFEDDELRDAAESITEGPNASDRCRRFLKRLYSESTLARSTIAATHAAWPRDLPLRFQFWEGETIWGDSSQELLVRVSKSPSGPWVQNLIESGESHPYGLAHGTLQFNPEAQSVTLHAQICLIDGEIPAPNEPCDVVWQGVVREVPLVDDVREVLEPYSSPETDQWVEVAFDPGLVITDSGRIGITVGTAGLGSPLSRSGLGVSVRVSVIYQGEVVADGNVWHGGRKQMVRQGDTSKWPIHELQWKEGQEPIDISRIGNDFWTIRVESDPDVAINGFGYTRYWEGEFEVDRLPYRKIPAERKWFYWPEIAQ